MARVLIAKDGALLTEEVMTEYPSGEPCWKPGFKVPDGAAVGLQWTGSMNPLLGFISWLRGPQAPKDIKLVLPFLPCARQDKPGPEDGDLSAGVFYSMELLRQIGRRQLASFTVLDPHSSAPFGYSSGLLVERRMSQYAKVGSPSLEAVLPELSSMATLIVGPDEGSDSRIRGMAQAFDNRPYCCHAEKERDQSSGAITGLNIDVIEDQFDRFGIRHIVVVDDICTGGATFITLAQKLRERLGFEFTMDLFCTHGALPINQDAAIATMANLYSYYRRVVFTDSCSINLPLAGRQSSMLTYLQSQRSAVQYPTIVPILQRMTIERSYT